MNIQWFPGHMTKSLRNMENSVRVADAIFYVLDSRAVKSCFNPAFDKIIDNKAVIYILNKADLVDSCDLGPWRSRLSGRPSSETTVLSAVTPKSTSRLEGAVTRLCAAKLERLRQKGVKPTLRAMVIGVPNSGKSTIINNLCGEARTKTGNKAGVTRGEQWVKAGEYFEVLDTPGTLYPKLCDPIVALHLAFIGSVRDEVLDVTELGLELAAELLKKYPGALAFRYGPDTAALLNPEDILRSVALKRGSVLKGGVVDISRAAISLLDDFRKGRLGKLMLDRCADD